MPVVVGFCQRTKAPTSGGKGELWKDSRNIRERKSALRLKDLIKHGLSGSNGNSSEGITLCVLTGLTHIRVYLLDKFVFSLITVNRL